MQQIHRSPLKSGFTSDWTVLQRYMTWALSNSPILMAIPLVRRLALRETILAQSSDDDIREIFVECLADSPYIPSQYKDAFADSVFSNDLPRLSAMLQLPQYTYEQSLLLPEERLSSFREMTIGLFSASKIICQLSLERKRELGMAIHNCQTPYQIRELTLTSLENSEVVPNAVRERIANDILDGRYERLLLPDRFDCEETPRLSQPSSFTVARDDCSICLMSQPATCQLPWPGRHRLCKHCVEGWASKSGGATFTCPFCRGLCRLSEVMVNTTDGQ
jgi:hypothetical protein